jgi:hypothetical protein
MKKCCCCKKEITPEEDNGRLIYHFCFTCRRINFSELNLPFGYRFILWKNHIFRSWRLYQNIRGKYYWVKSRIVWGAKGWLRRKREAKMRVREEIEVREYAKKLYISALQGSFQIHGNFSEFKSHMDALTEYASQHNAECEVHHKQLDKLSSELRIHYKSEVYEVTYVDDPRWNWYMGYCNAMNGMYAYGGRQTIQL